MRYCLPAVLLFCCFYFPTAAQTLYLDSTYSDLKISTHRYDPAGTELNNFDYYRAVDAKGKLPLIVFVHGGGFAGGARDDEEVVGFVSQLAHRGYAVASVSYRLTMKDIGFGCDVPAAQKIQAINTASDEIGTAIRYILDHESDFEIDADKVVIAGSSAGAEVVLNLAYVYKTEALSPNFRFAGVIGIAGAIISTDQINSDTAIPTQLFHGTGDELVPYHIAPHHYCDKVNPGYMILHGSRAIADRLRGLGASYYLYTVTAGSHEWATLPMIQCIAEVSDFLYHDVLQRKGSRQTERTLTY